MKAVIYARYSSDSQREESIEGQLRECTEYAERNGITVLRSYIDRALSARTADRPEFQNMIVYNVLIVSHEFVVCRVLIAKKSLCEVGVKLRVVDVEFLCNLVIVRVEHIHRNVELYRVAVVFLLSEKI